MTEKRVENQTFKQNRKYFLISAMFLIGIFQHRTLLMIIERDIRCTQ